MIFYVYFDRHGYSGEVCSEEELERKYGSSPGEMRNWNSTQTMDSRNYKYGRVKKYIRPNRQELENLLDERDCRIGMNSGLDCTCGCHHAD